LTSADVNLASIKGGQERRGGGTRNSGAKAPPTETVISLDYQRVEEKNSSTDRILGHNNGVRKEKE